MGTAVRVQTLSLKSFRRFSNLTIRNLPETTRLVVLVGPNGSGKSSLFDAFRTAHGRFWPNFGTWDALYHQKDGAPPLTREEAITVDFHGGAPATESAKKKLFYIRSAYRHEADFMVSQLSRQTSALEESRVVRLIENDAEVQKNYQRLVSKTVADLYDQTNDAESVKALRERLVGQVRQSMMNVFGDLVLSGVGDPLRDGTFFFEKGSSKHFRYKNLSGGEKAAFDLLLDIISKRAEFDDTVYCIDEPELHMHTRLQSALLGELVDLLPPRAQLWMCTHSIGMMKKAKELRAAAAETVAILDFHDRDFDQPQVIEPAAVTRKLWSRALHVALDDLSELVAPKQVVVCEGDPLGRAHGKNPEFDARCYRTIFADELSDVEFLSAGGSLEVEADRLALVAAITALTKGTTVIRVVDRDDKTSTEIADLAGKGVRVLGRRHIEAYLFDDEVLRVLCNDLNKAADTQAVLAAKATAIQNSIGRGNPADDMKSAKGEAYSQIKRILGVPSLGNTVDAFCRDTLAPRVPKTAVYAALRGEIFGP